MHTLSVFPVLFDFQLLAAFFLRIVLAYALARMVWQEKKGLKTWSLDSLHGFTKLQIGELAVALFLFVGLYTQIATILALVSILMRWNAHKKAAPTGDAMNTSNGITFHENLLYIVLSIIAIVLLFLGAGFLAFDLPL